MLKSPAQALPVVIIGAGIGGVVTALRLTEAGFDVLILERAEDVGGTWFANTYPGCAVDTSILSYSLSDDPDPGWSRLYAPQREILDYVRGLVRKGGLRDKIRLNSAVSRLEYDDRARSWTITLADGEMLQAKVVIGATGVLSEPKLPAVDGIDQFQGELIHSGAWRSDVPLRGKRVAVVGTGCSAAQIVPEVAKEASSLLVFQRSAPWVFPRNDQPIEGLRAFAWRRLPLVRRSLRYLRFWANDLTSYRFEHRSPWVEKHRADGLAFIERSVSDPDLRALVTPDYLPGCKRRLMSDDWYPALQRDNVQLIPSAVTALDATRVRDGEGTWHEVDVVVFATGFAATDFVKFPIVGRNGRTLSQHWEDGARTHLGVTVAGFPNYFIVGGPSVALAAGSYFFTAESQARYIVSALRHMRRRQVDAVDLKPSVETRTYADVQRRLSASVFGSGCQAWYRSSDGQIDTVWPGTLAEFWWKTRRFAPADYEVVAEPQSAPRHAATNNGSVVSR